MSGKKLQLKYEDVTRIGNTRRITMDLSAYFLILQYLLMGSTAVALLLIFLYAYYGKDKEESEEKEE